MSDRPADDDSPEIDDEATQPHFSIVAGDRLVAYVWRRQNGTIRRAGSHSDDDPPQAVAYADLLVFDAGHAALLGELAKKAVDFDAFRFKVELEEFRWVDGAVKPDARSRRF